MADSEQEHVFKIILLGSTSVGKSQILMKFTKGTFNENAGMTVGVEFSAKNINVLGKNVRIQVWDTAGQEKFHAIARAYYKGAAGALLVYDITKQDTFASMEKWLQEIQQFADQQNIVCMLIGNKNDLEEQRQVGKDQAIQFAQSKKLGFLETSAKTGYNIDFAFKQIAEEIIRDMKAERDETEVNHRQSKPGNASVLRNPKDKKAQSKQDSCC